MSRSLELIKRHFIFLTTDYGFYIDFEIYSPEIMGNVEVIYKSASTIVKVVVDRSQVLLNIGNIHWLENEWFEFSDVIQYFCPFIEKIYEFSADFESNENYIESQAKHLALLLLHCCDQILKGDFSMQDEIREIESKRVTSMLDNYRRLNRGNGQNLDK